MNRSSIQTALLQMITRTPWLYGLARQVARTVRRTSRPIRLFVFARFCIRDHGARNVVELAPNVRLSGVQILMNGSGNRVAVAAGVVLTNATVTLQGSNNTVELGCGCQLKSTIILCEDDGNHISIGDRTRIAGSTELAAMEGTEITIGSDCLFSGNIHVRTGDSHSVVNFDGKRVNPSNSINLGNHVWVGTGVTMLKGVSVAGHSIVGAHAVVTKQFEEPNCAIAGNPARVIRRDVDWLDERIDVSA